MSIQTLLCMHAVCRDRMKKETFWSGYNTLNNYIFGYEFWFTTVVTPPCDSINILLWTKPDVCRSLPWMHLCTARSCGTSVKLLASLPVIYLLTYLPTYLPNHSLAYLYNYLLTHRCKGNSRKLPKFSRSSRKERRVIWYTNIGLHMKWKYAYMRIYHMTS